MRFFLTLILLFSLPLEAKTKYRYEVAACVIARDERRFLEEWVEYHRLLGVEHFYFYDHLSRDRPQEVLAPYIARKELEVIRWPFEVSPEMGMGAIQCNAYNDAVKRAKGVARWLIILDADEFLVLEQEGSLKKFLEPYRPYGGVVVNWRMFGPQSIFEMTPAEMLMTELLTCCALPEYPPNCHVKSIVRPQKVAYFGDPHAPRYKKNAFAVNTQFERVDGPFAPIQFKGAQCNHYWLRDPAFQAQKGDRRRSWGDFTPLESLWPELNATSDYRIQKSLPRLRKSLRRLSLEEFLRSHPIFETKIGEE